MDVTDCQMSVAMILLITVILLVTKVTAQEDSDTVIAQPGQNVGIPCNVSGIPQWRINGTTGVQSYTANQIFSGQLAGHNTTLTGDTIIVEDIMMNDDRNGTIYTCFVPQGVNIPDLEDSTILYVAGVPFNVSEVKINVTYMLSWGEPFNNLDPIVNYTVSCSGDNGTCPPTNVNGTIVTLTLSWGEPFNNLDPILNYTVSCSGNGTCFLNFTTTDNTTRSYNITNLTPMTNYTFSVVATNSIGSGEAGMVMITTPSGVPGVVPDVTVDNNTININGNNVNLTLSWGEPFSYFGPIVNYTVSCSGDVTCPLNYTTTDNTTRSYTITNLTPMTNYTFSVVATNSFGSGEAGVVMITTLVISQVVGVVLQCDNVSLMVECTVTWDGNSLEESITTYHVNSTVGTFNVSNDTTLTFVVFSFPGGDKRGKLNVTVTAMNMFGMGPPSESVSKTIYVPPHVQLNIMMDENTCKVPITVNCNILTDSPATMCMVIVLEREPRFINASQSMEVAEVDCDTTYIITHQAQFDNGTLIGASVDSQMSTESCPIECTVPLWIIIIVAIILIILMIHAVVGVILQYYHNCKGSDHPKISELCDDVRVDVAPHWYNLGLHLLNPEHSKKLSVIQSDHPEDSEKCCTAMFDYWLRVDTTASRDKLIIALNQIGQHELANRIGTMKLKEPQAESRIRLVLLVILGVLTFGISNLIWYIYLKCSNDKVKAKRHSSILVVSIIVTSILGVGLPVLFWHLICPCCFKKKKANAEIPLGSPKITPSEIVDSKTQDEEYAMVDKGKKTEKPNQKQNTEANYLQPEDLEIMKGPEIRFQADHTVCYGQFDNTT